MNQIFDLNRFGRYFSYLTKIGARKYLAYMGGALGVALIIELLQIMAFDFRSDYDYVKDPMWDTEFAFFSITFFGIIVLAGSMMFSDMGSKSMRLSALMVPSSQLEKFITRLIVALPITIIVSFIGFEVVDLIRCFVAKITHPNTTCIHPIGLAKEYFDADVMKVYCGFLLAVQSIFVLGGVIWPKNSWLKTLAAMFVLVSIYSVISFWLGTAIFRPNMHYSVENFQWVDEFGIENLVLITGCVMAVINYVVAYMRLTELELVQRW